MLKNEEAQKFSHAKQPMSTRGDKAESAPSTTERASKIFRLLQYNYVLIPLSFILVHRCKFPIPLPTTLFSI